MCAKTYELKTLGSAGLWATKPDGNRHEVLGSGKPLAILIYLALAPKRTATREHLRELLWAESTSERGYGAPRQSVWELRNLLGDGALIGDRKTLTFALDFVIDRDEFLEAVRNDVPERAVECYSGEFLPNFGVPGGRDFEDWAHLERLGLQKSFLRLGEDLARSHLAAYR